MCNKHKHSKLTSLELYCSKGIGQDGVDSSSMFKDLETGTIYKLKHLTHKCGITLDRIKVLCGIFNNGRCTELRELKLAINRIGDEGASVLYETLIDGLRGLTSLNIGNCFLRNQCMYTKFM